MSANVVSELTNKVSCSKEEEWLLENFKVVQATNPNPGALSLELGIDAGSTGTRWARVKDIMDIGEGKEISSVTREVLDIEGIKSRSEMLYSNLEYIMKDITPDNLKPVKVFNEVHFCKGELADIVSGTVLQRPSNTSKIDLKGTYLDILTAISLEILSNYKGTKIPCKSFIVELNVALPTECFSSVQLGADFKKKLAGTYDIIMPRLGISITVKIKDNIYLEKENQSVIYSLTADDEIEDFQDVNSIGIDGGGKNTDTMFIREGVIIESANVPGAYGGDKLLEDLSALYEQQTGRTAPTKKALKEALNTGILVRAGKEQDITDYVKQVKNSYAEKIFGDINKTLAKAEENLEDSKYIVFHGRLFSDTVSKSGGTFSIASLVMERVTKVKNCSDIKAVVVLETDKICQGVVYSKWTSM